MLTTLRTLTITTAALVAAVPAPASALQNRPTPADAGPLAAGGGFVIQSCGESGSSLGWTVTRPSPDTVDAGIQCPAQRGHLASRPAAFDQSGIWVSDRLGKDGGLPDASIGDHAEVAFATQPGTTITRLRYWRKVVKTTDDNWQPYIAVGTHANIVDTCEIGGQVACQIGADDWYANDPNPELDRTSYIDRSGLNASSVFVGLTCRNNPDNLCGPGYSIPYVEAQLYSVFLTIADSIPPMLQTPSGSGWASADWLQGDQALAVASSDTSGIDETRLYIDGSIASTVQRSCSYDRPRPCTDEPSAAISIPTSGLADGAHAVQIAAVDAAGNETLQARPAALRTDNTAPASPLGLASPSSASSTNTFTASWSLPADPGSPIVAARYQLCQNGTCSPAQTAARTTSASDISLPAPGSATLRVWLVDQLGHEDPSTAAELPLSYTPAAPTPTVDPPSTTPTPPQPPSTPPLTAVTKFDAKLRVTTVRRISRRVTIAGSLTSRASGRVTIRYRARVGGRLKAITKTVSIRRHTFRTTLTLSRTIARATKAAITVSYRGDSDTRAASRTATLRIKR